MDDTIHTKMCSIPTAGTLTTSIITIGSLSDDATLVSKLLAKYPGSTTSSQINLCDCACKGYWFDNMLTLDNKKCSKCIIPYGGCPALMTPNAECTACECSTPLCKKTSSYLFTTLYLKPPFLRWLESPSLQTIPTLQTDLTVAEFRKFIELPAGDIKHKYRTAIREMEVAMMHYYTTELDIGGLDPRFTTKLTSVSITPVVEGSFTAWMVTFNVVNTASVGLGQIGPEKHYGMAPFPLSLSQLFTEWLILSLDPTGSAGASANQEFKQLLMSLIEVPEANPISTSKIPLFTSNTISTKCISYQDHITSKPIAESTLYPCPSPHQYVKIDSANLTPQQREQKLAQFNPLWSPCSDPTTTTYHDYQTLSTNPTRIPISTRQVYPKCFDLAGTDLSKHYIPCEIEQRNILYSPETATLLHPTYTVSLLSSFDLTSINPTALPLITQYREQKIPKYPQFPHTTTVMCAPPDNATPPPPTLGL